MFRQSNPRPRIDEFTAGPPILDTGITETLENGDPSDLVAIDIGLRNFPDWNIPLLPPQATVSLDTFAEKVAERERAFEEREDLFDTMASGIITVIEANGGRIVSTGSTGGWIIATVTVEALRGLSRRTDLQSISDLTNSEDREGAWGLGPGRKDERLDIDRAWDAGYDGSQSNPSRHSYGDITVAVIEPDIFEDEACFLKEKDDCTGASRLVQRFDCDDQYSVPGDDNDDYCETVSSYTDTDSHDHGTQVASTILADYTQDQGNGKYLGDSSWNCTAHSDCGSTGTCLGGVCKGTCSSNSDCPNGSCDNGLCRHSSTWEDKASGIANEASLIYFGDMNDDDAPLGADKTAAYADAYKDSIIWSVDITNRSGGWMPQGNPVCSATANVSFEKEAENAFDDGIFNAACAGNGGTAGTCGVWSPGAIPKVFAVNGLDGGSSSACSADYHDCLVDLTTSAEYGGGDVKVNGSTKTGAASLVDAAAPSAIRRTTNADGLDGTVLETQAAYGCSFATPIVSGMAAVAKDWYLAKGDSWINNPGVLHTLMMGMTDRASGTSLPVGQRTTGSGKRMGLGRMKFRLNDGTTLGSGYNTHYTDTFYPPPNYTKTYPLFGSNPLSDDTQVVKCVLFQYEDTSSDSDPPTISNLNLTLEIRNQSSGACVSTGQLVKSREDDSYDWKSLAAIEDQQVTGGFGDRCAYALVEPAWVESSSGISMHLFCYAAETEDSVPH